MSKDSKNTSSEKFKFISIDDNKKNIKRSSNDKFKFVSDTDIEDNSKKFDKINIVDSPEKVNISNDEKENEITKFGKFNIYFGFTARVVTMVILIIIMFVSACLLIHKVVDDSSGKKIHYNDVSKSSYQVCLNGESVDDEDHKCRSEGIKYAADNVKTIVSNFIYKIDFLEDVDYKLSYHVSTIVSVRTKDNKLISSISK